MFFLKQISLHIKKAPHGAFLLLASVTLKASLQAKRCHHFLTNINMVLHG